MRNEMIAMVKMRYYMWMILEKKLSVLTSSEKLLQYLVKSAELRFKYGMDKLSSYYRAQAMLSDMTSMRLMVEFEIRQQRIELNTLMNREAERIFSIDTAVPKFINELASFDSSDIVTRKSEYLLIGENISILRAKQNLERAKLRPDFGIKYDHMVGFGRQPQQFSLMGMVTIPIAPWSSKMYRSAVSGLKLEMEALGQQQQAILNNTGGALASLREQIRTKRSQLDLFEQQIIPSMKKNYEVSLIAFEQNKEELFMTIEAWQSLKLVRLNFLDMLYELIELHIKYEKELEIK
jgi:outer membrane protein TolC